MKGFQHHKTIKNIYHLQIFVKDYPKIRRLISPTAAFDKERTALTASIFRFPHVFLADYGYLCRPEPMVGPNMWSIWRKQAGWYVKIICR